MSKVPFLVEEYVLVEGFLSRIPPNFWRLGTGYVTDEVDTRNPVLLLRVELDVHNGNPRIRISEGRNREPEAQPIPTTHELRNDLLTRLRAEEKREHEAEHSKKFSPDCGLCAKEGKKA
jgi:hypothetical protein